MIKEILIQGEKVYYEFDDSAPDDARERLSKSGDPTNPTVARSILQE